LVKIAKKIGGKMKIKILKSVNILTEQDTHVVKRGENLSGIGKKYGVDWRGIAKANNIQGPRYIIQPGQKLNLNTGKSSLTLGWEEEDSETIDQLAQKAFMIRGRTQAIRIYHEAHEAKLKRSHDFDGVWKDSVEDLALELNKVFAGAGNIMIFPGFPETMGLAASLLYNMLLQAQDGAPADPGPVGEHFLKLAGNQVKRRDLVGGFVPGFIKHCKALAKEVEQTFKDGEQAALLGITTQKLRKIKPERLAKMMQIAKSQKTVTRENKIFENYFEKNKHLLEQEMFELETRNELEAEIANAIETKLDDAGINPLVKTQEAAEKIYALVIQRLNNPEEMRATINSVVDSIFDQIPDSPVMTV